MREKNGWKPAWILFVKESLRNRPALRLALVVLVGLWIVTGTKLVTERILYRERNLQEAVAVVSPGSTSGKLLFAAKLQDVYLTEADQHRLLNLVAERMGLTVSSQPELVCEETRSSLVYRKEAKYADSEIKVICLKENKEQTAYYLTVTLCLFEDDGSAAMQYQKLMSELAEELGMTQKQVSVQVIGRFPHDMTLAARNRLTDRIMKKLGCKLVCESRDESLYTVYAYTKGMDEYIVSGNDRINVQLAMYYDEIKDETVLCLASPVITGEMVNSK